MGSEVNSSMTWISTRREMCPKCTSSFPAYQAIWKSGLVCPCCRHSIGHLARVDAKVVKAFITREERKMSIRELALLDSERDVALRLAELVEEEKKRRLAEEEKKRRLAELFEDEKKRRLVELAEEEKKRRLVEDEKRLGKIQSQAIWEDKLRAKAYHKALRKEILTYVIQDTYSNMVKIGITRGTPEERLDGLQLGCPSELVICAVFSKNIENQLHVRFSGQSLSREWFVPNWEMVKYINENADDNRRQVVVPSPEQVAAFRGRMVSHA